MARSVRGPGGKISGRAGRNRADPGGDVESESDHCVANAPRFRLTSAGRMDDSKRGELWSRPRGDPDRA